MNISLEDRIYGLSLLWREAEYNFAYWDERTDIDWNAEYRKSLNKIIKTDDPLLYYAELIKFMALLKDGHTYVIMPDEIRPEYSVPFGTTFAEKKHLLFSKPAANTLPFFSEILAVNDTDINDYVEKNVYPYLWHEKPENVFVNGLLGYVIGCCENDEIKLTTSDGESVFNKNEDVQMSYPPSLSHPLSEKAKKIFESELLDIFELENNILYVIIYAFHDEIIVKQLIEFSTLLSQCRGFIIDVRKNRGGSSNVTHKIAKMFFENNVFEGLAKSPINIASFRAYGQYKDIGSLDLSNKWEKQIYDVCKHNLYHEEREEFSDNATDFFLQQPVVILSGNSTASAAESFLVSMKHLNRATIIGTNSYGSNGQPYMGKLPGDGSFGICTQKCYMLDGKSYNNIGIAPDIHIENSINDLKTGFDKELDTAINYIFSIV